MAFLKQHIFQALSDRSPKAYSQMGQVPSHQLLSLIVQCIELAKHITATEGGVCQGPMGGFSFFSVLSTWLLWLFREQRSRLHSFRYPI